MNLKVTPLSIQPTSQSEIEIVERKGIGHPDTICDALAEALSIELCKVYIDKFGFILHHNVDKNLLVGGSAKPQLGSGKIIEPINIFLSGRATKTYKGVNIPVDEIAIETARKWLKENIHALDPEKDVKIQAFIRSGSSDLTDIYMRQLKNGVSLANDTSFGVGFAPFDGMENAVYHIERELNSKSVKKAHPEIGEDIKVMGVRNGDSIDITIACAFVDRFIQNLDDYIEKKKNVEKIAYNIARGFTNKDIRIQVNTGDDLKNGNVYITVTGTSSESGDDGEVGRGNRINGLITPYRPMSLEAAAGKNPVTHVGKLYNITANEIARAVVSEIPEIEEVYCYMVSQIGKPVTQPLAVDVKVRTEENTEAFKPKIERIVSEYLSDMKNIWKRIINHQITVY